MYEGKTIGVVVPAYNEEGQVGGVIETIPSYVDRIYAVDDASADDTWDEIREASARVNDRDAASTIDESGFPWHVVPLRHERNRGVGGAVKTGYLAALEDGIDVVAVMAGDGQMDPGVLPSILDPIVDGRADYAKGNRFLATETRRNVPPFRLFGNVLLSTLTKIASGYWAVGDSQNGYTAISRDALEAVDVEEMYEFYGYCNDLLVRLNVADVAVADVSAPIIYGDENSSINYLTYIPRVSAMLLSTFLWRLKEKYVLRDFHPLVLLYGVGAAGAGVTIWRALGELVSRRRDGASGAVATGLLSTLLLVFGMLQDKAANEDLVERGPAPDVVAEAETEADASEPPSAR